MEIIIGTVINFTLFVLFPLFVLYFVITKAVEHGILTAHHRITSLKTKERKDRAEARLKAGERKARIFTRMSQPQESATS
jgi:hypothetical protein